MKIILESAYNRSTVSRAQLRKSRDEMRTLPRTRIEMNHGSEHKSTGRAKRLNTTIARNIKKASKHSSYPWLPWLCALGLIITYLVMLKYPSWKTYDVFCNVVVVCGVILVASGSVLTQEMRQHLFDVKDFDKNTKDSNGNARVRPMLSQKEVAAMLLEASDRSEAGTLTAVIGTSALIVHLIAG
ncbi:hypothetical protein [Luteibacter sahnii]|uniref:hypothetical protein n=1 Tax=Luteibacter sahnii TaxID=3021977 RepID=UPI002A6B3863|nr:hypothetical protein [Luteibacter sp. PPL193]MDY1549583.1 hypothetical protein [Luteibacter sp. PPL193]